MQSCEVATNTRGRITVRGRLLAQAGHVVLEGALCWVGSIRLLLPVALVVPLGRRDRQMDRDVTHCSFVRKKLQEKSLT